MSEKERIAGDGTTNDTAAINTSRAIVDNVRRAMLSTPRVKPCFVLTSWANGSATAIAKFESKDGIVFLMHPDTLSHILRDGWAHEVTIAPLSMLLGVPVLDYHDKGPDAERARKIVSDALGSFAAGVW